MSDGIPIDSNSGSNMNTGIINVIRLLVVTHSFVAWTLFTAAALSNDSARDALIDSIWSFASRNLSQTIFPSVYISNGMGGQGSARYVVRTQTCLVSLINYLIAQLWAERSLH